MRNKPAAFALAGLFCLLLGVTVNHGPCLASGDLYVLTVAGQIDTLAEWQALSGEEYDLVPLTDGSGVGRQRLCPPIPISAIVHSGVKVPLEELAYLLPAYGIYMTREGHRILGRPLHLTSLVRAHRHIDVENQRMYLTDVETSPLATRPGPRYVFLDILAEYSSMRRFAGRERVESSRRSIVRAGAVVFDAEFISAARQELSAMVMGGTASAPVAGETLILTEQATLYLNAAGALGGHLLEGCPLTITGCDSSWCRFSIEGWMPLDQWRRIDLLPPLPPETEDAGN